MEETRWKEKNQYLGLTEDGRRVRLLDQSQLPNREVWLELEEQEELAEAIRTLRVRGAPAIGVAAAYGLYLAAREIQATDADDFRVAHDNALPKLISCKDRVDAKSVKYAVMTEGVKKGACQLRQTPFEGGEGENQNFRNQVEM